MWASLVALVAGGGLVATSALLIPARVASRHAHRMGDWFVPLSVAGVVALLFVAIWLSPSARRLPRSPWLPLVLACVPWAVGVAGSEALMGMARRAISAAEPASRGLMSAFGYGEALLVAGYGAWLTTATLVALAAGTAPGGWARRKGRLWLVALCLPIPVVALSVLSSEHVPMGGLATYVAALVGLCWGGALRRGRRDDPMAWGAATVVAGAGALVACAVTVCHLSISRSLMQSVNSAGADRRAILLELCHRVSSHLAWLAGALVAVAIVATAALVVSASRDNDNDNDNAEQHHTRRLKLGAPVLPVLMLAVSCFATRRTESGLAAALPPAIPLGDFAPLEIASAYRDGHFGAPMVTLDAEGSVATPSRVLGEGPALVLALEALQREQAAAAQQPPDWVLPEPDEEIGPAAHLRDAPRHTPAEHASVPRAGDLILAVDRRAPIDALRRVIAGAREAGFGGIGIVGPLVARAQTRRAAAQWALGGALLNYEGWMLRLLLQQPSEMERGVYVGLEVGAAMPRDAQIYYAYGEPGERASLAGPADWNRLFTSHGGAPNAYVTVGSEGSVRVLADVLVRLGDVSGGLLRLYVSETGADFPRTPPAPPPQPPREPITEVVPGDLRVQGQLAAPVTRRVRAGIHAAIERCVRAAHQRSREPLDQVQRWSLLVNTEGVQRAIARSGSATGRCVGEVLQEARSLRSTEGIAIVHYDVRLVFATPQPPPPR